MQQLRAQLVHPLLGLAPGADVVQEAGKQTVTAGDHLADRELHRKDRAVAALGLDFAADADDPLLAGAQIAGEVAVMPLAIGRGHQAADVAADHLLGAIAEHLRGGGVERLDDPGLVDGDQAVGRGIDDRAQQRVALEPRTFLLLLVVMAVSRRHSQPTEGEALPPSPEVDLYQTGSR